MLNNQSGSAIPIFFYLRGGIDEEVTKLTEDQYDVFVDDKYVGKKTLYTQNEDFHDVADFLERQGFQNIEIELNGDHIVVHADDAQEAEKMRQALEVYLNNR